MKNYLLVSTLRKKSRQLLVGLAFPLGLLTVSMSAAHPHLFVSSSELTTAVTNYQSSPGTYASLLPSLTSPVMTATPVSLASGTTSQINSLNLAWIAVAYRFTGNAAYLQRLRDWIPVMDAYTPPTMTSIGSSNGLNAGHILVGFSMVYDFIEGQGATDLEAAVQDLITRTANRLHTDLSGLATYPYEQNHLIIPLCGLSIAALALDAVEPGAADWSTLAGTLLPRSYASISHDGWFFEGISYWNYTMSFPTLQALAQDRATSSSVLTAAPFVNIPEYVAHIMLPNPAFAFDFGDWGPQPATTGYNWSWHSYPTQIRLLPLWTLLRERGTDALLEDLIAKLMPLNRALDPMELAFQLLWQIPPAPQVNVLGDSFESYSLGTTPTSLWTSVTVGGTNSVSVVADTTNRFGDSVDNRVLRILDNSSGLTRADLLAPAPMTVATLSFDFYEASGVSGTPLRVSLGGTSASQTAFQINLNSGTPGSYALNAVHHLAIVANSSPASVTYNNGTSAVGSLTYDLWIDNVRVVAGGGLVSGSSFTAGTAMAALRLTTDSGGLSQDIFIDNLLFESGATYVTTPVITPPPTVLFSEPPYRYFDDMEVLHWRSAWNDPEATALAFKSGPPAGHNFGALLPSYPEWKPSLGHAHPDAGSFQLYAGGVFLANDTGYTGKKETADHNSILVDGIGQHEGGTAWSTFNGKPYADYDQIRMEDVWLGTWVAAASANYRAAYVDTLELDEVRRDLVLVAGRFLLIRDTLASSVSHTYEWRLHMDREPVSTGTGRFFMQNGPAALAIQPLGAIASTQINATIVETELANPSASQPQQRGYHLSQHSPSTTSFAFLTACSILRGDQTEAQFTARKINDVCVEFKDAQYTCLIWTGSDETVTARFAFELRTAAGVLVSSGTYPE